MAVEKISQQRQTFRKNNAFQLSHGTYKKHTSKQVASIKYILEKKNFATATFEGL